MSRPTESVLVVDEAHVVGTLASRLEAEGVGVTVASGPEALRLAEAGAEVVVAPLSSSAGPAHLLWQAACARDPDAQLVVTVGAADLVAAVACLRAGASDVLARPVEPEALAAAVRAALERHRLRTARALEEATRTLLEVRDPARIPQVVADTALRELEADGATVLLADASGTLSVAASAGLWRDVDPGVQRTWVQQLTAGAPREPALFDRARDGDFIDPLAVHDAPHALLLLPLTWRGRTGGVLAAARRAGRPPFGPAELSRARLLASQMALALENARLMREMLSSARLQSVGALLGGVAHQMNNPITALVTSVRYVRDGLADLARLGSLGASAEATAALEEWWRAEGRRNLEDLEGALADALESADRIREITKDLRVLVRPDAGAVSAFDLGEVVRSAVRLTKAEVQQSADVELDLTPGALVNGSPGRLAQCFIHLILNSAQALAAAKRRGLIRIQVRREDGMVVAEVSDDGPGIPPEDHARVFDPFFTTRPRGSGLGLGLPICREILARHGGELSIRSSLQGTTVTMRLPGSGGNARTG